MRREVKAAYDAERAGLDALPAETRAILERGMPSLEARVEGAFADVSKMELSITLDRDGTATFSSRMGERSEVGRGTRKADGERIVIVETEKDGEPTTEAQRAPAPPIFFRGGVLVLDSGARTIPLSAGRPRRLLRSLAADAGPASRSTACSSSENAPVFISAG